MLTADSVKRLAVLARAASAHKKIDTAWSYSTEPGGAGHGERTTGVRGLVLVDEFSSTDGTAAMGSGSTFELGGRRLVLDRDGRLLVLTRTGSGSRRHDGGMKSSRWSCDVREVTLAQAVDTFGERVVADGVSEAAGDVWNRMTSMLMEVDKLRQPHTAVFPGTRDALRDETSKGR